MKPPRNLALLLLALAAAGCAAPPAPSSPPAEAGERSDTLLLLSLHGSAPRFHGDVVVDGYGEGTEGSPRGGGFGVSGEVRPRGWFAAIDLGWALFTDDLGIEEAHPDFAGADVDHVFRWVELLAGPSLVDRRAPDDASGDRRAPSLLRVDPFLGVRAYQLTVDGDFDPDLPGDAIEEVWVDPVVGIRGEWCPGPGVVLRARGDAGGLGGGATRDWRASASVGFRLGEGAWLNAGWNFVAVDLDRDGGDFRFHSRIDGPFLSIDFWF